jgi:hypothetical protein
MQKGLHIQQKKEIFFIGDVPLRTLVKQEVNKHALSYGLQHIYIVVL